MTVQLDKNILIYRSNDNPTLKKKEKYYFGVGSNQFDDNDINHLVERKLTTSLDICPTITHLLSIEYPKVAKDKRQRNGF